MSADFSPSLTIPCGQSNKNNIKVLTKDGAIIYYDGVFWSNKDIFSMDNQGNVVMSSVVSEDAGLYSCYGTGHLYRTTNVTGK